MGNKIISGMTNEGLRLLALSQSDETKKITFRKFKIGDGALTNENPAELNDLINIIDELEIEEREVIKGDDGTVSLKVSSIVKQAEQGYYFRELGLFVIDPETNQEVLYAYVNKGNNASYIPKLADNISSEEKASMVVAISNSSNITVDYTSDLKREVINDITNLLHKRNIGELVWSSVPLDDACLYLANGDKFYLNITNELGEEVENVTYKYFIEHMNKLKKQYPNANWYCSEEEWQSIYDQYNACGKYVIEKDYIRIPNLSGFIEGTITEDKLGKLEEAGLPNITGKFSGHNSSSGAFKHSKNGNWHGNRNNNGQKRTVSFDASRCSNIYGKSETVQPQAIYQYIYIVISSARISSNETEIEYDANSILTQIGIVKSEIEAIKKQNSNPTDISGALKDCDKSITEIKEEISYCMESFGNLEKLVSNFSENSTNVVGSNDILVDSEYKTTATVSSNNSNLSITCNEVEQSNIVGCQIFNFRYTDEDFKETEESDIEEGNENLDNNEDIEAFNTVAPRWVDEDNNDINLNEYNLTVSGTPNLNDRITLSIETTRTFNLSYDDTILQGKADKSELPTKVSDLQNDSGYLTEHQSLNNYALKNEIPTEEYINSLIDTKLGEIENGTY